MRMFVEETRRIDVVKNVQVNESPSGGDGHLACDNRALVI
jgi:hypothetical protein